MLIETVKKTVASYGMLQRGDTVVAAVSGGPDSVCLLTALRGLAPEYGLALHVAHLDHMFRGEGSARDAGFVADLAARLNIPATVERSDVPAYCAARGLGAQAGAREVRYAFLNRVADEIGAQRIAVGHTATDQAETVLMRLLRGAGTEGLSGIPPVRDRIIRPLIRVTRDEVLEHLRDAGLAFVTDPTNLTPACTRNRVRIELLPLLGRWNPRIVETLAREAEILRDEDSALTELLAGKTSGMVTEDEAAVRVARGAFLALGSALRRRALRLAVARLRNDAPALSSVQTEEALAFMLAAESGRSLRLPAGLELLREYDSFVLRPLALPTGFSVTLAVPGATVVPDLSLEVATSVAARGAAENEDENYLWQAQFDYDKIGSFLCLRSRRAGDRFYPAGMGGQSKKLQDFFVDEKVPLLRRDAVPLLATKDAVAWVVGMRLDGRFLPARETQTLLTVTLRRI